MRKKAGSLTIATICARIDLSSVRWSKVRDICAPTGTETLDEITINYIRMLRLRATGRPKSQDDGDPSKADHWRVEKLRQEAMKLDLENKRRRAESLDTEAVSSVWNRMLSNFRARVLQLPPKLMPLVSAAKSYGEAETVMKAGVNECLQELSECDPAAISQVEAFDDGEEGAE